MLGRLRLPLSLIHSLCEGCRAALVAQGRRCGCCSCSGRIKIRAGALENAISCMCRKAGGVVRRNVKMTDLISSILASSSARVYFAAAHTFNRRCTRWLSTASAVVFVRSLVLPKATISRVPFVPAPDLYDLLAVSSNGNACCPFVRRPTMSNCLALAAFYLLPCCSSAVLYCQDVQTEVFSASPSGYASLAPFRVVSPLTSVFLLALPAPPSPP